jgi:hypothetical protein
MTCSPSKQDRNDKAKIKELTPSPTMTSFRLYSAFILGCACPFNFGGGDKYSPKPSATFGSFELRDFRLREEPP